MEAEVAVAGAEERLGLGEAEGVVDSEGADDAEAEPLVDQPVEAVGGRRRIAAAWLGCGSGAGGGPRPAGGPPIRGSAWGTVRGAGSSRGSSRRAAASRPDAMVAPPAPSRRSGGR
ncbi:MAG: hypothetical protein AVDCRST_MAG19-3316 [uncultured Thermomicrobiales bacterium]|uniref:Uncharacterized protein n=1 Tax=uncultured Thermomicrobiales bacterium TaxID=1645740 RepID=A0A6J4VCZ7_9BACT|nr:MAG: hypothetical protein AVDCRST_MAG19-3316 [uncultured Thermomicrobiales bacterium]